MKKKILYATLFCTSVLLASTFGCAKSREPSDKIIAKVNNDPIYASDLKKELALKTKTDPLFKITPYTLENEVDNIINKRLLIQEALKLKLDRTKRFVNTIKTFWEQTLMRDLILAKNKEFEAKATVTKGEIKNYYNKLAEKVTFKIIKRKNRDVLERMLGIDKNLIAWEETVGPVGYEDINSGMLQTAFELPEGEIGVFKDRDTYYLVYAAKREPASAPPIEKIYSRIETEIKEKKQNRAAREWLKDIKDKSKIELNKEFLKTYGFGE